MRGSKKLVDSRRPASFRTTADTAPKVSGRAGPRREDANRARSGSRESRRRVAAGAQDRKARLAGWFRTRKLGAPGKTVVRTAQILDRQIRGTERRRLRDQKMRRTGAAVGRNHLAAVTHAKCTATSQSRVRLRCREREGKGDELTGKLDLGSES